MLNKRGKLTILTYLGGWGNMRMLKSVKAADLKSNNRVNLLRLISSGSYSRADLAAALGLSRAAVTLLVDELMQDGLVEEVGQGDTTELGGKKPTYLGIRPSAAYLVLVSFQASSYEIAVCDLHATILERTTKQTLLFDDYTLSFRLIIEDIRSILAQLRLKHSTMTILAAAISLRGQVQPESGVLNYSASLPGWREIPVRAWFERELGIPVLIENSARALTYAEMRFGRLKNRKHAISVSVSRGIGAGVVIQHELYTGAAGGGGTAGHTVLLDGGPLCSCGQRGCWETLGSMAAFQEQLVLRNPRYAGMEPGALFARYHSGDSIVRDVLHNHTCYWIGAGIANLVNLFNPEIVVLQGVITLGGVAVLEEIKRIVQQRALPSNRAVELVFSSLDASIQDLLGPAALILTQLYSPEHHGSLWGSRNRYDLAPQIEGGFPQL